jgi:hypothetical protein
VTELESSHSDTLRRMIGGYQVTQAIYVAARLGLADELSRHPATSEELAAATGADADALYRLLEEKVVPAFYDRDARNVPHRWIAILKESIRTVAPRFCGRRMVKEYAERMYAPALERRTVTRS